jgi:hypothetical protein
VTDVITPEAGLSHPEWVNGRRLWFDGPMRDLIHKLHHGDPVRGWEGDPNLAVYWDQPSERWEVHRLEDDGEYRLVCRSGAGIPFDERLIDALLAWDRRRRTMSLHDEVVAKNTKVDADCRAQHELYIAEEVAPRLRHAILKDG